MKTGPDIEGIVTLLPTDEGGRKGYTISEYRPQHVLGENWATSGRQVYLETEKLYPGNSALANIWFVSPLENSIWVGREIEFREGNKIVGSVKVTKVFNEFLLKHS